MGTLDIVLMIVILGGVFRLLYYSIWKKKGCCNGSGCGGGVCDKK